jgi:alkanesulfonate monooxygenase SsuD/methylene tetrahydromethanopterin reductase-like flavin-dependent oxidoreductase (luciferase family)
MRFGLSLASIGTYADPRVVAELAGEAEEAGWEGLFLWDHLAFVWGPPACDPWVALAAAAAVTSRITLGTGVTPLPRRRPHVVAHQAVTLDVLSGGRFVFGAGTGGVASEFDAFGEPTRARVHAEMLDEGLELLARLWSGERVRHEGRHYTVRDVALAPLPEGRRIPIWIGGRSEAAVARAARWDGWLADSADPEGMVLTPEEIAAMAALLDGEVAVIGYADRADWREYERAGATWWLESLHDLRGPAEAIRGIVRAGPPR